MRCTPEPLPPYRVDLTCRSVVGSHVVVSIDGTTYMDTTIDELTPFSAYVGFTAATGSLTNYHLIDALSVEGFVCDE